MTAAASSCASVEPAGTRVVRLVCSALALAAALVLLTVSAFSVAVSYRDLSRGDLAFVFSTTVLASIAAACLRRTTAAKSALWIFLAAVVSLVALAFTGNARGTVGWTSTTPTVTRYFDPTLGLAACIGIVLLAGEIAARLARASACSCE